MWGWKDEHYGITATRMRARMLEIEEIKKQLANKNHKIQGRKHRSIPQVKRRPQPARERAPSSGGGLDVTAFVVATEQLDTVTTTTGEVVLKPANLRGYIGERFADGSRVYEIGPKFTAASPGSSYVISEIWAFESDDPVVVGAGATHMMLPDDRIWLRVA